MCTLELHDCTTCKHYYAEDWEEPCSNCFSLHEEILDNFEPIEED